MHTQGDIFKGDTLVERCDSSQVKRSPPAGSGYRVAIYIDSLQGYGADKVLLNIANGLVKKGISVDLILAKTLEGQAEHMEPQVEVVDLKGSRFTPLRNVFSLANYLRQRKPDILFSSIHFNNVVAALALTLSGISCKLILRQANTLQKQLKDYSPIIAKLLYLLTCRAYKQADIVVSQCKAMVSDLTDFMRVSEDRIQVIYNPTISPNILQQSTDPVDHKWLTRPQPYPVLLSVGRLKPQKDFETLLRAFAKFKQRYCAQAKLIILGRGPLEASLRQLAQQLGIQQDVDFAGFHKNPYAFMAACDLYVSSSRYEGLSNTLIEALYLGKQVVATACAGGTAEILNYGQYGQLVPVGNPEAIAHGIAAALAAPATDSTEATRPFRQQEQVRQYIEMFVKVLNYSAIAAPRQQLAHSAAEAVIR